jgi:hypothetical protein
MDFYRGIGRGKNNWEFYEEFCNKGNSEKRKAANLKPRQSQNNRLNINNCIIPQSILILS